LSHPKFLLIFIWPQFQCFSELITEMPRERDSESKREKQL